MKQKVDNKIDIKVLEHADDPVFQQRESNLRHMPYQREREFYSLIEKGDVQGLAEAYKKQELYEIVVGRLSKNPLRQMQYWAVCCITLAVRYAIIGGLDEMQAYSLSDKFIQQIDEIKEAEKIQAYLEEAIFDITKMVHEKSSSGYPAKIRFCFEYINSHLHDEIHLADLAGAVGLSSDYLSKYFKKHVGISVSEYIIKEKLAAAKEMLRKGLPSKQVAYNLGFCSQTYFITCFKKHCGITPHKFAQM